MKFKNKRKKFGHKGYFDNKPRPKRKINEDFSNVSLKKGKLITVMISNFPKDQTEYKLDAFLKSKGIVCWGCRANFSAQVAFIDVDVKDCEKVLALNEQDWNGKDLAVKIDETTNVRKKKTRSDNKALTKYETIERHRRTMCCKNVPFDVFSQKIEALFKGVKEVYIVRDKRTGRPTGIAFVEFFTEEDFDEAWEKKDSVRINGRKLDLSRCEEDTYEKQDLQTLSKFLPKSNKNGTETVEDSETPKSFFDRNKKKKGVKTIVLSNFPDDQNHWSLVKYLKRHGVSVTECRANFDSQVAFLDVENKDVRKALRLNATVWNGHTITVEEETSNSEQIANYPQSKAKAFTANDKKVSQKDPKNAESRAERTLCCKNLPFGIFAQKLEILFQDVKEVRNLHDSSGQPTGMAYIEFFTKEALEVAFVKKDVELDGRKLQLSLMGPLAKTTMPSLKRTSDSEKLNQKSQSPVLKRKKKQFKKTKKGVVSSNKFMRR